MRFREFGLTEKGLSRSELMKLMTKDGAIVPRWQEWLELIRKGHKWTVTGSKKKVQIRNDEEYLGLLADWLKNPLNAGKPFKLETTVPGVTVLSSKIKKREELGGKSSDHFLQFEKGQYDSLTNTLKTEIQKSANQDHIQVKLPNKSEAIEVDGITRLTNKKADIALLRKGKEVAWISLKPPVNRYFRWGGFTLYSKYPDVSNFLDSLKKSNISELSENQSFGWLIEDTELKQKIIYGPQFGGESNANNVDAVCFGSVGFFDNLLKAEKIFSNGEIPQGDLDLYLLLRYTTDRSNFNIKNARAEAVPLKDMKSRKVTILNKNVTP